MHSHLALAAAYLILPRSGASTSGAITLRSIWVPKVTTNADGIPGDLINAARGGILKSAAVPAERD